MYLVGLDAGTTSISGVLLNVTTGTVERVVSVPHGADLPSQDPETCLQDPETIRETLETVLRKLVDETPDAGSVLAIGVTGQVHGILYLDGAGAALSPLYTWQDLRGRRVRPGEDLSSRTTWTDWAHARSGYRVPSGYGLLTHCINMHDGLVPPRAEHITTILGYLTMRLTGATWARIDSTDAHALGLFAFDRNGFDLDAARELGIAVRLLPDVVAAATTLGSTSDGIPVIVGLGDNQAAIIGSVLDAEKSILINVGTSSQLSMICPDALGTPASNLEMRPFPGNGHLLSGAALCGGSAVAMLERLFREVCRRYGDVDPGPLFDRMASLDLDGLPRELIPAVQTQFLGTREDPDARGSISGLGPENLSPDFLIAGFLYGIAGELARFRSALPAPLRERSTRIVGVGNGLRKNSLLRRILASELELPVVLPKSAEEAALGAAIAAGVATGVYEDYLSDHRPIHFSPYRRFPNETHRRAAPGRRYSAHARRPDHDPDVRPDRRATPHSSRGRRRIPSRPHGRLHRRASRDRRHDVVDPRRRAHSGR
ncbi:MAG: sedoheptulokinase [Spirochaetota bacterium]